MVMSLCCLCRIRCTNKLKHLQNCLGDYNEIYEIVAKYFDPLLLTERIKSKSSEETIICQNCWLELNGFHNFQQTIFKIKSRLEQRAQESLLTFQLVEENLATVISDDNMVNKELKQTSSCPSTFDLRQPILKLETPFEQTCIQRSPLHIKDEEQSVLSVFSNDCNIGNTEFEEFNNFSLVNTSTTVQPKNSFIPVQHSTNESPKDDQQLTTNLENPNVNVIARNCLSSGDNSTAACQLEQHHKKNKHGSQKFKCDKCGNILCSKGTLTRHLLIHTEGDKYFKCEECSKTYTHESLFKGHMRLHKKVTCQWCGKSYSPSNIATHMKIHTGTQKFPCDECGKELSSAKILKYHKETHLSECSRTKFRCNECGKKMITPRALKAHKESMHSDRKFCCDKCGCKFRHNSSLKFHKEICQNDGSVVYVCSICEKICLTERRLRLHRQRSHEKKKKKSFKCPYCDKVYKHSKCVREHIASKHTKKPLYQCANCSESFYSYDLYYNHRKTHPTNGEIQKKEIDYKLVKNIAII